MPVNPCEVRPVDWRANGENHLAALVEFIDASLKIRRHPYSSGWPVSKIDLPDVHPWMCARLVRTYLGTGWPYARVTGKGNSEMFILLATELSSDAVTTVAWFFELEMETFAHPEQHRLHQISTRVLVPDGKLGELLRLVNEKHGSIWKRVTGGQYAHGQYVYELSR